jgi:hypothetical protein
MSRVLKSKTPKPIRARFMKAPRDSSGQHDAMRRLCSRKTGLLALIKRVASPKMGSQEQSLYNW